MVAGSPYTYLNYVWNHWHLEQPIQVDPVVFNNILCNSTIIEAHQHAQTELAQRSKQECPPTKQWQIAHKFVFSLYFQVQCRRNIQQLCRRTFCLQDCAHKGDDSRTHAAPKSTAFWARCVFCVSQFVGVVFDIDSKMSNKLAQQKTHLTACLHNF